MQILDSRQVDQKIQRLAIEILERNFGEQEIVFAGINNNGMAFAKRLKNVLEQQCDIALTLVNIRINPASPLDPPVQINLDVQTLKDKVVIVVDDVANTGRTLFFALEPLMKVIPKKVEVAVLVDRKHKSFPIQPDYFGIVLSTTLQEHIEVKMESNETLVHLF